MKTIHVMLVEDDLNTLRSTRSYLETKNDIAICGITRNGKEAIELLPVVNPDFIVTDLVMPVLDGFYLLEHLQAMMDKPVPKVIILSALTRDDLIARAMKMGAYYYMCKPCDLSSLHRHIVAADKPGAPSFVEESILPDASAEIDIDALLNTQGIPCANRGYTYLHTAIELGMKYDGLNGHITKDLYPAIARLHGTSINKVERAIRHAIERGWERGNLRGTGFELPARPSNGEYIARMVKMLTAKNGAASNKRMMH